jgi:hypothetical protein
VFQEGLGLWRAREMLAMKISALHSAPEEQPTITVLYIRALP